MTQIKISTSTIVIFLLCSLGFHVQTTEQSIQSCNNGTQAECYICNGDESTGITCNSGFYQVFHSSHLSECESQTSTTVETSSITAYNGTEVTSTENITTTSDDNTFSTNENVTDNQTTTLTVPTTVKVANYILCKPCHHLCKTCNGDGLLNCIDCKYERENNSCISEPKPKEDDDSIGVGVIVGAVVGACAFVAIIIVIIVVILRWKRRHKSTGNTQPRTLEQLASVEESPTNQSDTEKVYQNIPRRDKGFGEKVQRKQDDITRYRTDPTIKEKKEKETPFYENKGIIEMHSKKVDNKKFKRNDSTEWNELKELGHAPPPPPSNEPLEEYENVLVPRDQHGSMTMQSDELEDYQNVPSSLRKRPTIVVEPTHPSELTGDPEPSEEYQNISQLRESGNVNASFVDNDLEPYGNEEAIQEWRRSGDNRPRASDDPIYGNVHVPGT